MFVQARTKIVKKFVKLLEMQLILFKMFKFVCEFSALHPKVKLEQYFLLESRTIFLKFKLISVFCSAL